MTQSIEKAQLDTAMKVLNTFVEQLGADEDNQYAKMLGSGISVVNHIMQVQNHYITSLERRIEMLEALISHG